MVIDPATSLSHELGDMRCVRILSKVIHVTNHSSFRKYYIARNKILLFRKSEIALPVCLKEEVQEAIKILFEQNRMSKVVAIIRGVHDGLSRKAN